MSKRGLLSVSQFIVSFLFFTELARADAGAKVNSVQNSSSKNWSHNIGLSYFTFFDGPGLAPGMTNISPNVLGKPIDDGLRLSNFISLKYKLSSSVALDFQMRVQWILNDAYQVENFKSLRWQSPRIGVSGKLLSGEHWDLTGAFNTDLPYFFPQPMGGGVTAQYRTTVFNPGLFAKFTYAPRASSWSVTSLVMPRFFIYANRNAAEPQLSRAGFSPELKNEFTFDISPGVNYWILPEIAVRLGTQFTYSKLILSDWNPLNGSLNVSDIQSKAWRMAPVPLQLGISKEWGKTLSVSVFIQSFPIAAQRVRRDGVQADFISTASIGMWISGTVI